MVIKRRTAVQRPRQRVTNVALTQIVTENHIETIDRLARIETVLLSLNKLPERVEKLEAHRNWLTGAIAVITLAFTTAIAALAGKI